MATSNAFPRTSFAETFPVELWGIVCKYLVANHLPKDNLCNFLLTSKKCATAATPYLFQSQHVSLMLKSLQNLQNVSEQPHLAKHVREIWYEPRLMNRLDRQHYNDLIQDPATSEDIERGWTIYLDWRFQQEYLAK